MDMDVNNDYEELQSSLNKNKSKDSKRERGEKRKGGSKRGETEGR